MGIIRDNNDKILWTYNLEDGVCTDSMALVTAKEYKIDQSIIDRAEHLGIHFETNIRNDIHTNKEITTDTSVKVKKPKKVTSSKSKNVVILNENENFQLNVMNVNSKTDDKQNISFTKYSLLELKPFMIQISGVKDEAIIFVDHDWDPPASLEGSSCVYVLHLEKGNEPDLLYVGETESIRQRLFEHRKSNTLIGYTIKAAIVSTPNKSTARNMESLLIRLFQKKGYEMLSDKDHAHSLFS